MSTFVDQVSLVFPGVVWTGKSDIHVSVCFIANSQFFLSNNPQIVLSHCVSRGLPEVFWARAKAVFPAVKWDLSSEEFYRLFVVVLNRDLHNKPQVSEEAIVNPKTKSVFYRIGSCSGYTLGFRSFWCPGGVCIRIRIVSKSLNTGMAMSDPEAVAQEYFDSIPEIKEPVPALKSRVKVYH